MPLRVGVLTISDRVSKGQMEDTAGEGIVNLATARGWNVVEQAVVPDEARLISAALRSWADEKMLDAVFTTGGTGLGPRDVTPEATLEVVTRQVPGISEALRAAGAGQTPHAILSRGVSGVRGATLIVNLPGSPGGASDGVQVVGPVLAHAINIIRGGRH